MLVACLCGCGEKFEEYDNRNRKRRYVVGHGSKGKKTIGKKGPESNRWKGGKILRNGYYKIWKPDHPFCDKQGYVREHRLVYENYLSILFDEEIYLDPKIYAIHHINKKITDNSLINLQLMTNAEHTKHHHEIDMSGRVCSGCNSTTTWKDKKGLSLWCSDGNNGYLCNNCGYRKRSKTTEFKQKRNQRLRNKTILRRLEKQKMRLITTVRKTNIA